MAPAFVSKIGSKHLSLALAAVLLAEGLEIAIGARRVTIDGFTGFTQGTVMMAGLGLLLLGLIAFLSVSITERMFKMDRVFAKLVNVHAIVPKLLSWASALVGAVVLTIGIAVALIAAPLTIAGTVKMDSYWLAALGAELFLVGAGLLTLRLLMKRDSGAPLIRDMLFLAISSAGVFIIGIAASARMEGVGGIRASNIELLGAQLTVTALVGVTVMLLNGRSLLGRRLFGYRLGPLLEVGVATALGLEGLVLAGLSAKMTLTGVGTLDGTVMLLGGLALAVVALLIPATYYAMERRDMITRKLATSCCLFLVFLFPFSLLV